MFKKYLETIPLIFTQNDPVVDNNFMAIPPQQFATAGNPPATIQLNSNIWELYQKEGQNFIILNAQLLKDILKGAGIVIVSGQVYTDIYNNVISFEVMDVRGTLSIEQLEFIKNTLNATPELLNIEIIPENSKIVISINKQFQIGQANV